jgi:hypothetical protein
MTSQQFFDSLGGAIANPQPDEFRRCAVEQAPLLEVRIFRNDRVSIGPRMLPDGEVVGIAQTYLLT